MSSGTNNYPRMSPERQAAFEHALAHADHWTSRGDDASEQPVYVALDDYACPLSSASVFTRDELCSIAPDLDMTVNGLMQAKCGPILAKLMRFAVASACVDKLQLPLSDHERSLLGPYTPATRTARQLVWFTIFNGATKPTLQYLYRDERGYADNLFLCDTRTLEPAWLDIQFPGWYQRYAVAQTLGLTDVDLLETVFDTMFSPQLAAGKETPLVVVPDCLSPS